MRVDRFFCFSLKTGALIIGYAEIIIQIIGLITMTSNILPKTERFVYNSTVAIEYVDYSRSEFPIAISFLFIFIEAAMIYGINQESKHFILPWLVIKFVQCTLGTFGATLAIFQVLVFGPSGFNNSMLFVLLVIVPLALWLLWYSFLCVYSYYCVLATKIKQGNYFRNCILNETAVELQNEKGVFKI